MGASKSRSENRSLPYTATHLSGTLTPENLFRFSLEWNQQGSGLLSDLDHDGDCDYMDLYRFITTSRQPAKTLTIILPGNVPLIMARIPAGTYIMGSTNSWAYPSEIPLHQVTIEYDFFIGMYEVTQIQWKSIMGSNPSNFKGDNRPVDSISWEDCQIFIETLNSIVQGKFRMPSEAEWEYACRAGSARRFYFGDSDCIDFSYDPCELNDYAWWFGNSDVKTHEVGQLLPNAYGLYDMYGNVDEWCEDDWHPNYILAPDNGSPWIDDPRNPERVLRGGSWACANVCCTSSYRSRWEAGKDDTGGLRLAMDADYN